jgi:hypothetical protein
MENVYAKHPKTKHVADEVMERMEGHTKWAANALVHLRNYRGDDIGLSTKMR